MPDPYALDDLDDLVKLASACLRADGGLPIVTDPAFLAARWGAPGATTRLERGDDGRLTAAAALRDGPRLTTLVDPAVRAAGVEAELLDWGLGLAPDATVESEAVTGERERLFASRGLTRIFGEWVMRIDLDKPVPAPEWPAGITLTAWTDDVAGRFHAVHDAAFRERPGFPGWPATKWITAVGGEDGFRPEWSVLATHERLGDAGFVTVLDGWIDQVGVVPAARGAGLGAALVRHALGRMQASGVTVAWLSVNVNNPARRLYERLGFRTAGQRARFQRAT